MDQLLASFYSAIQNHPLRKVRSRTQSTSFDSSSLQSGLLQFRKDHDSLCNLPLAQIIDALTPAFQWSNQKWDIERQQYFVENLLAGASIPEIKLYSVDEDGEDGDHVHILDGLQRLTALTGFIGNQFSVYGCYEYSDIACRRVNRMCTIRVVFYHFADHKEACRYYIAINKGISHSDHDLNPAYDFLVS